MEKKFPEDSVLLGRLIETLDLFRELDPEMPIQTVLTFLHVARKPGMSMTELAQAAELGQGSASRNIVAWTDINRMKQPGYDMVRYEDDRLGDARRKVSQLTTKGRGFLTRILNPWRR